MKQSNERYTPDRYMQRVKRVLGSIDLDPASCEYANRVVGATRYFTEEENGLLHPWRGKVWLNPPYGKVNPVPGSVRSFQKLFVEKLIGEYESGRVKEAIALLLGNVCFAHYFYPLWQHTLCFHYGSISFYDQNGVVDDFGFGSIFVYLGPNPGLFIEQFREFGVCIPAGAALVRG